MLMMYGLNDATKGKKGGYMQHFKKITCFGILLILLAASMVGFHFESLLHASDTDEQAMDVTSSLVEKQGMFLQMDIDGNIQYLDVNPDGIYDSLDLPEDSNPDVTYNVTVGSDSYEEVVGIYETMDDAQDAAETMLEQQAQVYADGQEMGESDLSIYTDDVLRSTTKPSVVEFKTLSVTTPYKEVGTNIPGYTSAYYAKDAAYLGTKNGKVKFKMAGVTGYVDESYVTIKPYTSSMRLSYYFVAGGRLIHHIETVSNSSEQRIGNAPSNMKQGVKYYSYDGHYFYTSYATMIRDYEKNSFANAINAKKPYYNYYQFLPLRSKTSFTAQDLDKRTYEVTLSSSSKMYKHGQDFINAQKYGVNASIIYGIAANESAWGNSGIAQAKNNIFGLNAVDSSPGTSADTFASVGVCINDFAKNWVSLGYLEPTDWRYYGSCLGDKQSGMNVKYASDPYWGEKAAAQGYYLEDATGKKDSQRYSVVVETDDEWQYVYKEPTTKSTKLYSTAQESYKAIRQYPMLVLEQFDNKEGTWLKIRSDAILKSDRSNIVCDGSLPMSQLSGLYSDSYNYAYVKLTDTMILASNKSVKPTQPPKPTPKPEPEQKPKLPGDVNQDGRLSAGDYVLIKNHIMGDHVLKGVQLKAADANQDGRVSAADYVTVKNKIMNR